VNPFRVGSERFVIDGDPDRLSSGLSIPTWGCLANYVTRPPVKRGGQNPRPVKNPRPLFFTVNLSFLNTSNLSTQRDNKIEAPL
jgi:hypothetical protein